MFNSKPATNTSTPLLSALGIQTQSIQPKTIQPSTIKPVGNIDQSQAPIVKPNTSDISAQYAAMAEGLKKLQGDLDTFKSSEAKTPTPESSTQGMWNTLLGKQQDIQSQVQASQQDLLDKQNAIYEKWGVTEENFQKIQGLIPQIADYQKQMADLDTREAQMIDNAQNRAGTDLAFASGETARIQRAYAIQKSGIAAQETILTSQAQALQGNWDSALKAANLFVDNSTKAQQQYVSDLKWGFENYSDIISSMTKSEQDAIKMANDNAQSELKRTQDNYWKQVDAEFKQQGLNIDWYNAQQKGETNLNELLSPTEASQFGVPYGTLKSAVIGKTPLFSIAESEKLGVSYGTTEGDYLKIQKTTNEIQKLKDGGKSKTETENKIREFLGEDISKETQEIIDSVYKESWWNKFVNSEFVQRGKYNP